MLVGVASLPPSLIPALQNIGILHHKKAKLPKHLQQSVHIWLFWPLFGQLLSKLCKKGHLNAAWQAVIGHFQIDWIDIRHNSAGAYFWLNFSLDLSKLILNNHNFTFNTPLIQLWCARSKRNMELKIIFSS